ncbi:MAG: cyclophilin-like fold protein [Halobacteriota archaeon]|nr:cyclophilin-like fold protein [Halobacteriota archaeon]
MSKKIEIEVNGKNRAIIELDNRNPQIAEEIFGILPIEVEATRWKDEVYFEIPLNHSDMNASPDAVKGDVSYWSPGSAFCIFFGDTQPVSSVNHVGRIIEGLEIFTDVVSGDSIRLRSL